MDDAPDIRFMISLLLRRAGHQVAEAEDGRAAMAFLAAATVDVVLTDYLMPGMDGLEFIQAFRANGAETPVVMITAYPSPELRARAVALGATFMSKPFKASDLLAALASAVPHLPARS